MKPQRRMTKLVFVVTVLAFIGTSLYPGNPILDGWFNIDRSEDCIALACNCF
jgi:hypothetical protein